MSEDGIPKKLVQGNVVLAGVGTASSTNDHHPRSDVAAQTCSTIAETLYN